MGRISTSFEIREHRCLESVFLSTYLSFYLLISLSFSSFLSFPLLLLFFSLSLSHIECYFRIKAARVSTKDNNRARNFLAIYIRLPRIYVCCMKHLNYNSSQKNNSNSFITILHCFFENLFASNCYRKYSVQLFRNITLKKTSSLLRCRINYVVYTT